MTEPKVVRRNPRFNDALSSGQTILKYIPLNNRDKWAAVGIGIVVLIVVALDSAWLLGWLPR